MVTARTAKSVFLNPPFSAGCMVMRPDDRRVDHLNGVGNSFGICQRFEQDVPKPGTRPAEKLAIDLAPFAKFLRQISPWRTSPRDLEDPIENPPVIPRRSSAFGACLDDKWFEKCPFRVRQSAPNQPCLPPRGSLESIRDSASITLSTRPSFVGAAHRKSLRSRFVTPSGKRSVRPNRYSTRANNSLRAPRVVVSFPIEINR